MAERGKLEIKTLRRNALAAATAELSKLQGVDMNEVRKIQRKFHEEYDQILPKIQKLHDDAAKDVAAKHRKALDQR
jgi:esterase/lipase